ncbi:efflux RND transporter periplasmic adaptor subunit [Flocculibacter collagenilyticus]|uniref:efflux RND transporter periplasmic adaptor subunit n=1 Tax=Flocculibacter collagenilyticus TaxID=2744479 RepID=UPI0018F69DF5|nr:HlyD family secretion protein [Flocculibacter collagenilyticus]
MIKNTKALLFVGLIAGVLFVIVSVLLKQQPEVKDNIQRAKLVTVSKLKQQVIAPQVTGFGRVMPKHVWRGVAEVSGRVIYRNPVLESGRMVPANTLLLEIDPVEYQLMVAQAQANKNASQVKLARMLQEEKNLKVSLAIEQQRLTLAKQELDRKTNINKQGLISASNLEQQEQSYYAQLKVVEDIQSRVKLLPDDTKVTEAQLKVDEYKLLDAQRKLAKTKLTLPFNARIAEVNIEQDQVVALGETMLVAHKLGSVQVKAELAVHDLRTVVASLDIIPTEQLFPSIEKANFTGDITLTLNNQSFHWPARVTRIAQEIDANSATIGVFLEVEQDFKALDLPNKPPLGKGMFVSATITGAAKPHLIVKEKALHGDKVYVMTEEDTLRMLPVSILFRNNGLVAISGDVQAGDRIVQNDLIPAIEGMKLRIAENENKRGEKSITGAERLSND